MKFICVIFSVLVLWLCARPCCDDDVCEKSSAITARSAKTSLPVQKECPGCSPFFSCGTCVGFTINKGMDLVQPFVGNKPAIAYLPYRQAFIHEVALSIWQPPCSILLS